MTGQSESLEPEPKPERRELTEKELEEARHGRLNYFYTVTGKIESAAQLYMDEMFPDNDCHTELMRKTKRESIQAIIKGYYDEEEYQKNHRQFANLSGYNNEPLKWYDYVIAPALILGFLGYMVFCFFYF